MSFSPPVKIFFVSIFWGFLLGILWDLNRAIKKNIKFKNKNVKSLNFVLDVIFSVLAVILTLTFFFMFTYSGFRAFVLIGELIGFILYFCTITKFVFVILNFLVKNIFKIFKNIFEFFKNLTSKLTKIANKIKIKYTAKKNKKIGKKNKKTSCFSSMNRCIMKKLQKYTKN